MQFGKEKKAQKGVLNAKMYPEAFAVVRSMYSIKMLLFLLENTTATIASVFLFRKEKMRDITMYHL